MLKTFNSSSGYCKRHDIVNTNAGAAGREARCTVTTATIDAGSEPQIDHGLGHNSAHMVKEPETLERLGRDIKAMAKQDAEHLMAIGKKLLRAKELVNATAGATGKVFCGSTA